MSEQVSSRPWVRPRDTGSGWTPVTWQGWLVTLAFILLFVATAQLIIPQGPRHVAVFPWAAAARRGLGLSAAGLGLVGSLATLVLEIGAFSLVARWKSLSVKPLD
jgi:hypothetical protein